MALVWRAILALALAVSLSGCTQAWMLEPVTPRSPSPSSTPTENPAGSTPASPESASPTQDLERDRYPYQGTISDDSCVPASRDLLEELVLLADEAGVIFTRGALVKADEPWWTVAVAAQVDPDASDAAIKDIDAVLWFVTNSPSLPAGHSLSTWPLNPDPDDDAADRALTCLSRVPTPPPAPSEDSPASYNGRLAPGATCTPVSPEMLKHLEGVGRVGGAITYSRGLMVQANKKWWTVAVTTEVHPNKLGHTRENVPEVVFFATNAPSKGNRAVYFVLDSVQQDTAAAAAARCLRR